MSSATSQIDIHDLHPTFYTVEYAYTDESLQDTIEKIASLQSAVFGVFPRLNESEREEFYNRDFLLAKSCLYYPSTSECDEFEKKLKERIIQVISGELKDLTLSIDLETNYAPEAVLDEIAFAVFKGDYKSLFPIKSSASIYRTKKKIFLDIRFAKSDLTYI